MGRKYQRKGSPYKISVQNTKVMPSYALFRHEAEVVISIKWHIMFKIILLSELLFLITNQKYLQILYKNGSEVAPH